MVRLAGQRLYVDKAVFFKLVQVLINEPQQLLIECEKNVMEASQLEYMLC